MKIPMNMEMVAGVDVTILPGKILTTPVAVVEMVVTVAILVMEIGGVMMTN